MKGLITGHYVVVGEDTNNGCAAGICRWPGVLTTSRLYVVVGGDTNNGCAGMYADAGKMQRA